MLCCSKQILVQSVNVRCYVVNTGITYRGFYILHIYTFKVLFLTDINSEIYPRLFVNSNSFSVYIGIYNYNIISLIIFNS